MQSTPWGGVILQWGNDKLVDGGVTIWHPKPKDTKYFAPSNKDFMINYRVDDMAGMITQLKAAGVKIQDGPLKTDNGIFAWILDPEGNKIELWEPRVLNQ